MGARIDFYPTDECQGYKMRLGRPLPFGATLVPGGVNFSVFSRHATACTLVLFRKGDSEPMVEIPFPESYRIGNVFCMTVFDLEPERLEYGYRVAGPYAPELGHRFDSTKILLDPYAKAISGRSKWGVSPNWEDLFPYRSLLTFEDFDWEGDRQLSAPIEDLVIYEAHVRSLTQHPSSQTKHPGTYAGLMEKIPYLKELGINCIELMPIYEFDEFENSRPNPITGQMNYNYWGYSTVGFFAPKSGYAATGVLGMQVDEFKNLVKQFHCAGIEVILDVVFNHTAEGNERGPTFCFRGLDNQTYYMLTPEGYYYNFSGCGNTMNCNNPMVRNMVLDCLRYWVSEYHVDGFRFDLAAILGRNPFGAPMANPPLLESLAFDPILAKAKLIAEAWDAGGLYQVGSFPAYGRWAEWNGKFRDDLRKFLKGDPGYAGKTATRIEGSPDLYTHNSRGPSASINFLTCHDGFTLYDLFSYNEKHNEANGEENRDGEDHNVSWNCGWEGPTDDPNITALRERMIKNAVTLLMLSSGIPMILMGDEMGRTKKGNNNTYCHDNELNWLDWSLLERFRGLHRFFQHIIAFRKAHPVLRPLHPWANHDYMGSGIPDISWHGTRAWQADFSDSARVVAFMMCGKHAKNGLTQDNTVYAAANMYWDGLPFELPAPPENAQWHVVANTSMPSPEDIYSPGMEPWLSNQQEIIVGGRSIMLLMAKEP